MSVNDLARFIRLAGGAGDGASNDRAWRVL